MIPIRKFLFRRKEMETSPREPKHLAKIFSPAKINLFFAVTGKRNDGYHNVFSATFALTFGDELEIFPAEKPRDEVFGGTNFFDVKKNSIVAALDIFRKKTGIGQYFSVRLKKNIPLEAGFGGGSSNGAAALVAINRVHGNILSDGELIDLSRAIGADCPFFVKNMPSVATGVGDIFNPIDGKMLGALKNYNLLIFKPKFPSNTRDAYAALGKNFPHLYTGEKEAERKFLLLRDAILSGEKTLPLFNTFADVFFRRHGDLLDLCHNLKRIGANAALTGSGSGFFCLIHKSMAVGDGEKMIKQTLGDNSFCHQTSLLL